MHHAQVEIGLSSGIWLLEHPYEVIPHLAHLKELFYFICHVVLITSVKQHQGKLGLPRRKNFHTYPK